MQPIGELIAGGIKGIGETVKQFVTTDKDRLEVELKLKQLAVDLQTQALAYEQAITKAKSDIIIAEAGGQGWLQRNWRPIIILTFTGLIVAAWFGWVAPNLDHTLQSTLLDIIRVSIEGYIPLRTAEKVMPEIKDIIQSSIADRRERRAAEREHRKP